MINIQCKGCTNSCCGKNPHLTPILLPSEEEKFREHSTEIKTPFGTIRALAKKRNNYCIFLNEKTMECTNYSERPLECKLYPFLLDFDRELPDVKLDKINCPNLNTLTFDRKSIIATVRKHEFPEQWVKAYQSTEGY